jgi:hypothetical protein
MIKLPKDAEGREIPLDTEVLYDECGTKVSVKEFLSRTLVESQKTEWTIKAQYEGNFYYNSFKPKNMHLTLPDTWEKLEEDLGRAAERDVVPTCCRYFNAANKCNVCPLYGSVNCDAHSDERAFENILDRIRKLRGEDK